MIYDEDSYLQLYIHRFSKDNQYSNVSGLVTGRRKVASSARSSLNNIISHGKCKIEPHADTIVAGRNCVILSYVRKECDINAFSDEHDTITKNSLVQAATA